MKHTNEKKGYCKNIIRAAILSGAALTATTPATAASLEVCMSVYKAGDYKTAADMFEKLAVKGNAKALRLLANMYMQGTGVIKNTDRALKYYEKAADKGDTEAAFRLGIIYMNGEIVEENENLALEWLERASLNGHKKAEVVYHKLLDADYGIGC